MSVSLGDELVYRRAGGRRRHNRERQVRAELRRAMIGEQLLNGDTRAEIAASFGVSTRTIDRDIARMLQEAAAQHRCPLCQRLYIGPGRTLHAESQPASE